MGTIKNTTAIDATNTIIKERALISLQIRTTATKENMKVKARTIL